MGHTLTVTIRIIEIKDRIIWDSMVDYQVDLVWNNGRCGNWN